MLFLYKTQWPPYVFMSTCTCLLSGVHHSVPRAKFPSLLKAAITFPTSHTFTRSGRKLIDGQSCCNMRCRVKVIRHTADLAYENCKKAPCCVSFPWWVSAFGSVICCCVLLVFNAWSDVLECLPRRKEN